jgi:hypothetical protein
MFMIGGQGKEFYLFIYFTLGLLLLGSFCSFGFVFLVKRFHVCFPLFDMRCQVLEIVVTEDELFSSVTAEKSPVTKIKKYFVSAVE